MNDAARADAPPLATPPTTLGWPTFLLLAVVAAFPRLVAVDLVSVTPDEGIHGLFAMNIALWKDVPTVGLPSIGIRNSALFMYALAVPYAVFRHPLAGVVWIAVLNVATVLGAAVWLSRRFGRTAGVVAGLLYATAPWAVMYGRNMWPPSLVAPLALLLVAAGLRWIENPTAGRLLRFVAFTVFLPQMHFSAFVGLAWTGLVLTANLRKVKPFALAGGVLLGLATWAPWIWWQHFSNNWVDVKAALAAARGQQTAWSAVGPIVYYWQALLHSVGFDYWFGAAPSSLPEYFPPTLESLRVAVAVALVAVLLAAYAWTLRGPTDANDRRALRWLAVWTLLPVAALLALRPVIHPHYVGVVQPFPILILAAAAGRWAGAYRGRQAAVIAAATAVGGVHLWFLAGWLQYAADDRPNGKGHFELSYRQRAATVESVLTDAPKAVVHLAGPFTGLAPAYYWIFNYEQIRRDMTRFPADDTHRYWIDVEPLDHEEQGPIKGWATARTPRASAAKGLGPAYRLPYFNPPDGWVVEKRWRIGPSRVLKLYHPEGRL
ncbi:MAG: hypothetical protein ACRC1K_13175 [Planctomycetia bacterium]